MFCDNQAMMYIASNPMFQRMGVDYHLIWDMVMQKQVVISHVKSCDQLGDLFI